MVSFLYECVSLLSILTITKNGFRKFGLNQKKHENFTSIAKISRNNGNHERFNQFSLNFINESTKQSHNSINSYSEHCTLSSTLQFRIFHLSPISTMAPVSKTAMDYFTASESAPKTPLTQVKRAVNDSLVNFPLARKYPSRRNNAPTMNQPTLDKDGFRYLAIRSSIDLTKTPNADFADILAKIILALLEFDGNLKLVAIDSNGNVIKGSEIDPNTLKPIQYSKYLTTLSRPCFNNKQLMKFTFFVRTTEARLGGYIFNWAADSIHRFDVSPILTEECAIACLFFNAFIDTINTEDLKEFLYARGLPRDIIPNFFEKSIHLNSRRYNNTQERKIKAIAMEVALPQLERTKRFMFDRQSNDPVFYGPYALITPAPLRLHSSVKSHRDHFTMHKEFFFSKAILIADHTYTEIPEEIANMFKHLLPLRSGAEPLVRTISPYQQSMIFATTNSAFQDLQKAIEDYVKEKNLQVTIRPRPLEDIEYSYLDSSIATSITPSRPTKAPAVIALDDSSVFSASTTVTSPYASKVTASPAPCQADIQGLIDTSIAKNNKKRAIETPAPSDERTNELIDLKLNPVKNLFLSTTQTQTNIINRIQKTQAKLAARTEEINTKFEAKTDDFEATMKKMQEELDKQNEHSKKLESRIERNGRDINVVADRCSNVMDLVNESDKEYQKDLEALYTTVRKHIPDAQLAYDDESLGSQDTPNDVNMRDESLYEDNGYDPGLSPTSEDGMDTNN